MKRKYYLSKKDAPLRNFLLSLTRKRTPLAPETVLLETHSGCNGLCVFCPYETTRDILPQGRMDDALFLKVVGELAEMGVKKIIPCFINEPFLDPDLLERLAHIRKQMPAAEIAITTNASALTAKKAERLIRENLADEINISFQGLGKESYEQSMKGLSYEKTLQNVNGLLAIRAGAKKPRIAVTSVETNIVQSELRRASEYWNSKGVEFRSIPFETRSGEVTDSLVSSGKKLEPVSFCRRPFNTMVITFDGQVPICCVDYTRKTILGNAAAQHLSSIWNGEKFNAVREQFIQGKAEAIPACRNCSVAI